jgi:subtilisin
VIDSGVDLHHKDLTVTGGENTVQGEDPNDFGDNGGEGHGTHVAGIIAAHGTPPTGVRGLAPGAELYSFRVFGKEAPGKRSGASNFAIAKAIDRAVKKGCDIINMSLGGGPPDDALRAAMEDAVASGAIVIVASGNDDRSPVSFPASESPPTIAVSAMGRKGLYPKGTTGDDAVAKPFGKDKKNFIAAFSNVGPQIDLTCAGVGIISTVPGGYVPMDGTSMATPAVSGFAARLLSGTPAILSMPRDSARSDAMTKALLAAAKKLGFGASFEGHGFPS